MKGINMKNRGQTIRVLIAIAVGVLLPVALSGSSYSLMLLCFIGIYVIAISGLDILFGYCGQISLGHAAFYAIGAYMSGILNKQLGVPIMLSMIISSVVAAAIGMLLAYPASKLVFHFLSLATMAFGEIVYQILMHSPGGITGDYNGLTARKLSLFGFSFSSYFRYYYFVFFFLVLLLVAKTLLIHSKTGRAFVAIRENPHAANGMGIDVRKYKVMAFATSAFYTAFAGAMYIHLVGYVHPDTYQQSQSVLFLTMLLFGGSGSLVGPILGVISIELLIETLRFLQDYQSFVYGILLLIVIIVLPGGLKGAFDDIFVFIKRKFLQKRRAADMVKEVDGNAENK